MVEVVFDGFVVAAGDAVFGDGAFGVFDGIVDGFVEFDDAFAAGHFAILVPTSDDAALALLIIGLGGGGVLAGGTFSAKWVLAR